MSVEKEREGDKVVTKLYVLYCRGDSKLISTFEGSFANWDTES